MSRPPRRQLPLPDGDAPKRPVPPPPADDNDVPPPIPGRRPPPLPPSEPEKNSDSSSESDSEFDSDSSYEKMKEDNARRNLPPSIPNRGYRQPSPSHGRQDFSPHPPAPSRQPPPRPGQSGQPPLPPPGRPRVGQVPPIQRYESEEPDEVYDDGDVGEIYDDDVEIGEPEDTYDDGTPGEVYSELEEEKPQQPPKLPPGRPGPPQRELPKPPPVSRLPPPPPVEEQAVYEVEPEAVMPTEPEDDNIYEMEPDVDPSLNKTPPKLPSRPSVSQDDDPQETYDEFELEDAEEPQQTYDDFDVQPQEVYEDVDDDSSKPPPPPPPAGRKGPIPPAPAPPPASKATPPIPKPKDSTPAKTPVKAPAGPGVIDTSAIMSGLQGLRKVGIPAPKRQSSSESDKIYGDDGIHSAFEKFKAKDQASSGSIKPLLPKSAATVANALKKSSSLEKSNKPGLLPKPGEKSPTEPIHPSSKPDSPKQAPPKPARTPSPPSTESLPPPPPVQRDRPVPVPYSQVKPHISNGNPKPSVDEEDEDDDIYDDAISNRDPLLGEPWYFKTLKDRKTGDKLLKSVGKDGTFLIRESTKKGNLQPYTMMVLFQNNVYNLKIRERADGKMALGEEKPDEMAFMDVQKLVKYHRETEVILVGNTGQYKTLLKHSPPQ